MTQFRKLNPLPLTPTKIAWACSLLITLTGNVTFFQNLALAYPPNSQNLGFLLSMAILFVCFHVLFFRIFQLLIPARILASLLLFLTAGAAYFSDQFGTVIDTVMIQNTLETNVSETSDLLTLSLVLRVLFFAVLPCVLLWRLPYRKQKWLKERLYALRSIAICTAIMAICLFSFSAHYASFFREHKPLRASANPVYPIYSAVKFAGEALAQPQSGFVERASFAATPETDHHSELIILVVGETARSDHFSLNGYPRDTNPHLEAEERIISYSDISACGTSTSISVPCMFSVDTKKDFNRHLSRSTENILDILKKAGVHILWRDNNSDSKGVAERVAFEDFRSPDTNPVCDIECRDAGMLDGLQEFVDSHDGDMLIVLHQMGSHGPAYFKRYPEAFELFQPACRTAELSDCAQEEIINAYDNTIAYTDYFLSQAIAFLKANTPAYETTLFYISDHGESLGEGGIFLHGMPYMFAPEAQTSVPVIIWAGESSDVDFEKSRLLQDQPNSHDAVARTLLELFEIQTDLVLEHTNPLIAIRDE